MTTPTAALVEEAEKMAARTQDPPLPPEVERLLETLAAALRRAEAELDAATTQLAKKFKRLEELERRCTQAESERDELRATVTRLNRRAQTAEAGVLDNVEASKAAGKSMGRTLANAAADMYRRRAEKAEAERDAQAELVGKLTAERDDIAADLDEARAQVWGLICAGTNIDEIRRRTFEALAQNVNSGRDLIKVMIFYQRERDEARAQLRELESTRDLLTEENARLQARVATLELLLRGGK